MMNLQKIKQIALIRGGLGSEKEISLLSAEAVKKSFDELHIPYTILESDINISKNLAELKPDYAFLATHGKYAEDGILQSICEYLKIPYTGSGILASAICMNKCFFKQYISKHKILTPDYQILNLKNKNFKNTKININLPVVIKPATEGSTMGITLCKKQCELIPALEQALKYDSQILVESYIKGRELAVSFLGENSLTPVEVIPKHSFYDYESKYKSKQTTYILPPKLDEQVLNQCKNIVQQLVSILQIRTYCRADFIIKNNTQAFILEINTLPGLTKHSLLPKSAQHDGISFNQLILHILKGANLDYN